MALLSTEPVDWALDSDGDVLIPMRYGVGLDAVQQGIRVRVQIFRGEWFLDLDLGVPYLVNAVVDEGDQLLGGKFNAGRAREAFRAAIASAPGVLEITSLTVEFDGATRALAVAWKVRTTFGDFADTLEVF